MADTSVRYLSITLQPQPARVVIRPFIPADDPVPRDRPRAQRIADRVLALDREMLAVELARVTAGLSDRHCNAEAILLRRCHEVNGMLIDLCTIDHDQSLLIGAYFREEHAFEGAALLNPSIVAHPDQSGVIEGDVRFVLALRVVGEGHVSSVTFRTGIAHRDGMLTLDAVGLEAVAPRIELVPGTVPDDPGVRLVRDNEQDLSQTVIFPVTERQRHGI